MTMAIALLLTAAVPAQADDPQARIMARIEQRVRLPRGAAPLRSYRRFYAWSEVGKTVWTVYTMDGEPKRLWLDMDDMPIYMHAGCRVVSFDYRVADDRVSDMHCY